MDLPKAFDKINHDLWPATLKAYWFSINALDLICSFLKDNRRESIQINNKFSSAKKVYVGVSQDSI